MERYFQFPLCALSFGENVYERLNCIASFGCIEVGRMQWQKFKKIEKELRRSGCLTPQTHRVRIDFDEHLQVVAGAEHLRILMGNVERMLAHHARLQSHKQVKLPESANFCLKSTFLAISGDDRNIRREREHN